MSNLLYTFTKNYKMEKDLHGRRWCPYNRSGYDKEEEVLNYIFFSGLTRYREKSGKSLIDQLY